MNKKQKIGTGIAIVAIVMVVLGAVMMHTMVRYPSDAPEKLGKSKVIKTFPPGSFVENIVTDSKGQLYASVMPMDGNATGSRIWVQAEDRSEYFIDGTGNNLAFSPNGHLFSTAMTGNYQHPETVTVRLDEIDGKKFKTVFTFPAGALINGIAFDNNGNLFAADSRLGCIWRLSAELKLSKWSESIGLSPQSMPGIPGANGLRYRDHSIWTVNSSTAELFKIAVEPDGTAGSLTLVATGVPGDGFAITEKGTVYLATHPFNTITEVTAEGAHTVVGNPKNQIIGATDIAISPKTGRLLVAQDGGGFLDLVPIFARWLFSAERGEASIVELEL